MSAVDSATKAGYNAADIAAKLEVLPAVWQSRQ